MVYCRTAIEMVNLNTEVIVSIIGCHFGRALVLSRRISGKAWPRNQSLEQRRTKGATSRLSDLFSLPELEW